MNNQVDANFMAFGKDISRIVLPGTFTFPFDYTPHPIAIYAANQLKNYLETQQDWVHDFGIENINDPNIMGKMFGVLVVRNAKGQLGYLQSFSGIVGNKTQLPYFVPPIFDRQDPGFIYAEKEKEIVQINTHLFSLENNLEFLHLSKEFESFLTLNNENLKRNKSLLKQAKKIRQQKRKLGKESLSSFEFDALHLSHQKESRKADFDFKKLHAVFLTKKTEWIKKITPYSNEIERLKSLRKQKSAEAQQLIFDHYQFKNANGESEGIQYIFQNTPTKTPPSGAGDCAAPKLMQYAFVNGYTPIALAEFWWGKSPKLEVRQHKSYYPACKAKCHPILSFMLTGLELDPNPVTSHQPKDLVIQNLFEDDWILVINKPAFLLSVPGKELKDSVQNRLKKEYPNATGPMVVHRLDMGTSGIMVIAKDLKTYHHLQQQFISRTIKKQYTAILDGIPLDKDPTINLPLRVDLNNRPHQVVCEDHGKPAQTRWELLDTKNGKSKVRFYPHTGRTHQLRVHASHPKGLHTPIYGDELYGYRLDRLHLHASRLEFIHPHSEKLMCIASPAPFNL